MINILNIHTFKIRNIAKVAALVILLGGIGAGLFLLGQNQDIREKAAPERLDVQNNNNPHVYILEVGDNVDNADIGIVFPEVTKAFYAKYSDKYDFLAIFPSFNPKNEPNSYSGLHSIVQNNARGICVPIKLIDKEFWGAEKLKSIQIYPYLDSYEGWLDNMNSNGKLLLEETSHHWLTAIGKKKENSLPPGQPPDGLTRNCIDTDVPLLHDDSHWSRGLQSLSGSFGAMRDARPWVDNGDGSYSFDSSLEYKPRKFHPFDLYLMGFLDKSEVKGEYLLLSNLDNPELINFPNPEQPANPNQHIITTRAKAQKVTIDDIIRITGEERNPSAKESQKDFTIAFVILTKKGVNAPESMISAINLAAENFPQQWAYATDNLSTMNKNVPSQGRSKFCIQVIQPAVNSETGECREFATPCDVPDGWDKIQSCPVGEPKEGFPNASQKGWHYGVPDVVFEWQYHWVRAQDGHWAIFSVGQTGFGDALLVITGTPGGKTNYSLYPGKVTASKKGFNVSFSGSGATYQGTEDPSGDRVVITAPDFSFNGVFAPSARVFRVGDTPIISGILSPDYYSFPMRVNGKMQISGAEITLEGAVGENDHQYGVVQDKTSKLSDGWRFSALSNQTEIPIAHDWVFSQMDDLLVTAAQIKDRKTGSVITNYLLVQDKGGEVKRSDDLIVTPVEWEGNISKKVNFKSTLLGLDMTVTASTFSPVLAGVLQEDGGAIAEAVYQGRNYQGQAIKESTPKSDFSISNLDQPRAKPGDVDKDGKVGALDLGIIIEAYGTEPVLDTRADLNRDGRISAMDIGEVIEHYGE